MTEEALTTPTLKPKQLDASLHFARPFLLAIFAVVSFSLIVGGLSWRQCSTAANLRRLAREIQPGENILEVDNRLGKSKCCYETGWPYPGAPPTKFGAMYGGAVNDFRQELDSLVSRIFRGTPRWYPPQQTRSWPVLVTYDCEKRVTAVFIDGVEINSPARQRAKR